MPYVTPDPTINRFQLMLNHSHRINQCWAGARGYLRGCPIHLEARLADQLRRTAVHLEERCPS